MPSSLYLLTETKVGGDLGGKLAAWLAEGQSVEDIAYRLRSDHGVTVSVATLYRWVRDLEPVTP